MKRRAAILCLLLGAVLALSGCGGGSKEVSYKDGTYTGKSQIHIDEGDEEGNGNGYGEVTLTIKDNVITECEFLTYEEDGTQKDEDYGKSSDSSGSHRDYYNKAQKAVQAASKYAEQLVETGSLKEIDAITGATINYHEFQEAVEDALKQAENK
ncbi:MAG: FMN-binding protein [Blautia sp.]|nr:FMN-binding protein [Blautia sp.]